MRLTPCGGKKSKNTIVVVVVVVVVVVIVIGEAIRFGHELPAVDLVSIRDLI